MSASYYGHDMVDVESRLLTCLSQAAILAAIRRPRDHLAPQVSGNAITLPASRTHPLRPKADCVYGRALAIWEKTLGPEHPKVAICLKDYASLLRKMNGQEEAARLEARANAIQAKSA